ncbi:MAG: hypothetical protein GY702_17490 [Desulfobulbaceae bacterium]|nr:hypothetical protein [Desulfobulbaceae bacterium]
MTTDTTENSGKNSKLLPALREGVGLVQMILFKELRQNLQEKNPGAEKTDLSMLAGAITNEVFGTQNPEKKFANFREQHWGKIEQELLSLKENYNFLCRHITDALRIQTLCDNQEGGDSSQTLVNAKNFGYLIEDRDVPLPSIFMTLIRELGKEHNLIVPPVQITPEQDKALVH